MSTTPFEDVAPAFGEIVLVPFPFTDQSATKRRPAVVISSARYNDEQADLILMPVTSRVHAGAPFELSIGHWQAAGLLKPSLIKPVIATFERSMIARRLGRLTEDDEAALCEMIERIIG